MRCVDTAKGAAASTRRALPAAFFPDWQELAGGARPYISMTVSAIIPD